MPKTISAGAIIEIYSELASAERPDFGEGAMTRHVTKRLASGERPRTAPPHLR